MTEQILKRANDLMKNIEKLRDNKARLQKAQEKYYGINSGICERAFCIIVYESGDKTETYISADSAEAAFDAEIKRVSENLEELEKEFKEL